MKIAPPKNGITFWGKTEFATQNFLLQHHALYHRGLLQKPRKNSFKYSNCLLKTLQTQWLFYWNFDILLKIQFVIKFHKRHY